MKNFIALQISLLLGLAALAQDNTEKEKPEEKKGFQKERLFIGGNFGLTFGDYTLINVSPQVGYRFTDRFAAGLGINAQYVGFKDRTISGDVLRKVSQGVVGLNIFGRFYPVNQFFLQLQPEANYIFGKQVYPQQGQEFKTDAAIAPSLLAGAGAALPAGKGAFMVSVFYDLLQHKNAPYGQRPIYNFGYNFGF